RGVDRDARVADVAAEVRPVEHRPPAWLDAQELLPERERGVEVGDGHADVVHPRWGRVVRHASVRRRRTASNPTAEMSRLPRTTSCQKDSTFRSVSPLSMMPRIRRPMTVPKIDPRPPARLAPPRITAVTTFSS